MDCTKCGLRGCRKLSPCVDNSEKYIEEYYSPQNSKYVQCASTLVDNGRAGKLNRLEEIVEYCKLQNHSKIGVAYCYSMEKEAEKLRIYLEQNDFKGTMLSCTVDGISESRINKLKEKQVVSCNPIGQARFLNESGVDFVILMGLCLGHDIIFQKNIAVDFTTFVVKDRVFKHNPILALNGVILPEDTFLEEMPENFNLMKKEELEEILKNEEYNSNTYILDIRTPDEYIREHIKGAINCSLKELPKTYKKILQDKKKTVLMYCNGGIQSIYAVMYLNLRGYRNVKSLSGGYLHYKDN